MPISHNLILKPAFKLRFGDKPPLTNLCNREIFPAE